MGAWAKGRKGGEGNKRGRGGERAGERIKWKVESGNSGKASGNSTSNLKCNSKFNIQDSKRFSLCVLRVLCVSKHRSYSDWTIPRIGFTLRCGLPMAALRLCERQNLSLL